MFRGLIVERKVLDKSQWIPFCLIAITVNSFIAFHHFTSEETQVNVDLKKFIRCGMAAKGFETLNEIATDL